MAKKEFTRGVTPQAECLFAHVKTTEKFKDAQSGQVKDTGKFSIMLKLEDKDKEAFLEQAQAEWDKFYDTIDEAKKKKMKIDPVLGLKEYKDVEYIKFSLTKELKCKDGSVWDRHIAVLDSQRHSILNDIEDIGNGSIVRVAYELRPYFMSVTNFGVSVQFNAVQVIEMRAGNSDEALAAQFDVVDGGFTTSEHEAAAAFGADNVPAPTDKDDDGEF